MRYDPAILIARTRAEAFEEAAAWHQWLVDDPAFHLVVGPHLHAIRYLNGLADIERAKIPTRDNRITDCIEIDTPSPYPLADSGLDGI
jgi:hypothetical protein